MAFRHRKLTSRKLRWDRRRQTFRAFLVDVSSAPEGMSVFHEPDVEDATQDYLIGKFLGAGASDTEAREFAALLLANSDTRNVISDGIEAVGLDLEVRFP